MESGAEERRTPINRDLVRQIALALLGNRLLTYFVTAQEALARYAKRRELIRIWGS